MSTSQALSLKRKLRMYQEREALLGRIGSETFAVINLDHFLQATVTEVGKIMEVDRSDVMTLTPEGFFRITHEYRRSVDEQDIPSLLGLEVRTDFERLQEAIDLYNPQVIEETASPDLPPVVQKLVESFSSRSGLIVPITFNLQLLGLIGLHHCQQHYHWNEDEITFIRHRAQQIAIGYRYTHIYSEKEREARINKALLEIANDINTGSDFTEVTERILDRALALLSFRPACVPIIDPNNGDILSPTLRPPGPAGSEMLKHPSLK